MAVEYISELGDKLSKNSTAENLPSGVSFGFPSIVGRAGVIRRLDVKLSEKEGVELQKSINALKKAINSVKI